ncbi:hypothetical protein BROUX41_001361 [Berkeleyomyces rouxiae]|uniref:uncharacterized protein n=1 Tax=Berkeleyomyces rouxiae TaxID=2035830 RepID=UPI003B769D41
MGFKNHLQAPGSSRYLLYIPTDSEYSRLVSSKPTKAELENILNDARVLDRPGGGRRRVKRFFLLENRSDSDEDLKVFRSGSAIKSRHSSQNISRIPSQAPSCDDHITVPDCESSSDTSSSSHIPSSQTSEDNHDESQSSTHSLALSHDDMKPTPHPTLRLNPEATEFQPMVRPVPKPSCARYGPAIESLGESINSQDTPKSPIYGPATSQKGSELSSSTSSPEKMFCDGTNEDPLPQAPTTYIYNTQNTSTRQVPISMLPFGFPPQFANVMPTFHVPHDAAQLLLQTA